MVSRRLTGGARPGSRAQRRVGRPGRWATTSRQGSRRFAPTSASSLNRKYEGTGLGLPLAKALVELHGGSLVLDSRVGEGTRATAYFPAARIVPGGDARPRV